MPVLPLVASTIVPPGPSRPRRSASSTMLRATRSFMEPPGFRYSHLTKISADTWRATFCSLTIGVRPIASRMLALAPVMVRRRSGLEVIPAVRGAEVIDDALFQQLLHGLAAVAGRDAVVVLVGDNRHVPDSRVQLLGVQGRPTEQRVREDDDVPGGHVRESAEAQEGVHLQQLQRERDFHRHALDELGHTAYDGAV